MTTQLYRLIVAAHLIAITGNRLHAQMPRIAVDGNVGLGYGMGGPTSDHRWGVSTNATVAVGREIRPQRGHVLAASLSWQGPGPHGDSCTWDFATGKCRPIFPSFSSVGLLLGLQQHDDNVTIRELIGPAVLWADGNRIGGIEARVDAAFRTPARLRAVLGLKGSLVPQFQGRTYGLLALMFGVGVQ
jgi:hypothetical protein